MTIYQPGETFHAFQPSFNILFAKQRAYINRQGMNEHVFCLKTVKDVYSGSFLRVIYAKQLTDPIPLLVGIRTGC